MTDMEVLKSYRYAVMEICALEHQLDLLMKQSEPQGLVSARLGDTRGTNFREARISQNMELCEQRLNSCRKRLESMTQQFDRVLAKSPDERTRAVLSLYYAGGMTDESIGSSMGYCTRTISNVRNRFLKQCGQQRSA